MKFKKPICLFLAGLTVLAATVNFTVSGKDSNMAKLMKNNVEAKTLTTGQAILGILDPTYFLYLWIEGLIHNNADYEILVKEFRRCSTYHIGDGVATYGSDAAKQLLAEFAANADANNGAVASGSASASAKYRTSTRKTDTYLFTFSCDIEYSGNWQMGYCVPASYYDSGSTRNCRPFDSCSQLQELRVEAFKRLISSSK